MCSQKLSDTKCCACVCPEKALSGRKLGILRTKAGPALGEEPEDSFCIGFCHSLLARGCLNFSKGQVRVIREKASKGSSWSCLKGLSGEGRGKKTSQKEIVCVILITRCRGKNYKEPPGIEVSRKLKWEIQQRTSTELTKLHQEKDSALVVPIYGAEMSYPLSFLLFLLRLWERKQLVSGWKRQQEGSIGQKGLATFSPLPFPLQASSLK